MQNVEILSLQITLLSKTRDLDGRELFLKRRKRKVFDEISEQNLQHYFRVIKLVFAEHV